MCLILDNNKWGDFLAQKPDMKPIHDWLKKKNGKLVYSNHKKFQELSQKYKECLRNYKQAGKAKLIPKEKVEQEIKEIENSDSIRSMTSIY